MPKVSLVTKVTEEQIPNNHWDVMNKYVIEAAEAYYRYFDFMILEKAFGEPEEKDSIQALNEVYDEG
jgi:hypothetical protein